MNAILSSQVTDNSKLANPLTDNEASAICYDLDRVGAKGWGNLLKLDRIREKMEASKWNMVVGVFQNERKMARERFDESAYIATIGLLKMWR